jgi:preprotein translocase subunit SecY
MQMIAGVIANSLKNDTNLGNLTQGVVSSTQEVSLDSEMSVWIYILICVVVAVLLAVGFFTYKHFNPSQTASRNLPKSFP